jgi:hypothetical protein
VYANRKSLTPGELMVRFDELAALIGAPAARDTVDKAQALAMYIARSAPNGTIANLAMQVMSAAVHLHNGNPQVANDTLKAALSQLQIALSEANPGTNYGPPRNRSCS